MKPGEILAGAGVCLTIIASLAILCFTLYSCDNNSNERTCIENGGSWVIGQPTSDENTYADYECQM